MPSFAKMVTDAGDQYLSTLSEMQENFLKATAAYSARVAAMPTPAAAPAQSWGVFPALKPRSPSPSPSPVRGRGEASDVVVVPDLACRAVGVRP